MTSLQRAAEVVPIEDDYVIGKVLGDGRFSVVKECVHKQTGRHFAVKIIDKTTIEPGEKVLLRTEIAILKLVDHPNIIRMEGLYESKRHIYIVMEMLLGGELFERIVGRPRYVLLHVCIGYESCGGHESRACRPLCLGSLSQNVLVCCDLCWKASLIYTTWESLIGI